MPGLNLLRLNLNPWSAHRSAQPFAPLLLALAAALSILLISAPAHAVRVADLYSAEVELAENSSAGRNEAFRAALAAVLVKVTGQEAAAELRAELFPDPSRVLQQYRRVGSDRIRVAFNAYAVRQRLDEAGLPVWNAERPSVIVWLAVDEGVGNRTILGTNTVAPGTDAEQAGRFDLWRDELREVANSRGLPLMLPLADAQDLSAVSFADLWGGFGDVVVAASARYSADVVLIGRARTAGAEGLRVRWTLIADGRQQEWDGDIAAGPRVAADKLGAALATYAAAAGTISVTVGNLGSFDEYAAVLKHLRGLSIVESAGIARVNGDRVEFAVVARVDQDRLDREIRRAGKLRTWSGGAGSSSGGGGLNEFRLGEGLRYVPVQ